MNVIVGADHRGMQVADIVVALLRREGMQVQYVGPSDAERHDYPAQAFRVALAVSTAQADLGILLSGSGIGMCITANKLPEVRAVVGHDEWTAQISRAHHDSNVLCIATDMIGVPMIKNIVERWLRTAFEGGRHARRVSKIRAVERGVDPEVDELSAGDRQ